MPRLPTRLQFKHLLPIALLGLYAATACAADLHAWPANRPTPSLRLKDIDGKPWNLASLRGKVVVLNFWASWCDACVEEMPFLSTLANEAPDRLVVLGVDYKESATSLRKFAAAHQIGYPILMDATGENFRHWAGAVLPTSVLIDRKGKARWYGIGALDASDAGFRRALERMLKE